MIIAKVDFGDMFSCYLSFNSCFFCRRSEAGESDIWICPWGVIHRNSSH